MHTITPEAKKELIQAINLPVECQCNELNDYCGCRSAEGTRDKIIDIVESFFTESAWISVEDRLPDHWIAVLIIRVGY